MAGGGPRGLIEGFGSETEEGRVYDHRVVGRLLGYLRPHTTKMVLALVLMVITTGLTLLIPYLVKVAIDTYIANRDFNGLSWTALAMAGAYVGVYVTDRGRKLSVVLGRPEGAGDAPQSTLSTICNGCRWAITIRISSASRSRVVINDVVSSTNCCRRAWSRSWAIRCCWWASWV